MRSARSSRGHHSLYIIAAPYPSLPVGLAPCGSISDDAPRLPFTAVFCLSQLCSLPSPLHFISGALLLQHLLAHCCPSDLLQRPEQTEPRAIEAYRILDSEEGHVCQTTDERQRSCFSAATKSEPSTHAGDHTLFACRSQAAASPHTPERARHPIANAARQFTLTLSRPGPKSSARAKQATF